MPYLGNTPSTSFATVVKDSFSGDGSTVAFTLSKVATTNSVSVFVENVRQEPTTAYAVSGTTLTFTAAPVTSSGNNIYVLHMNPTTTTTHPAAQNLTAVDGTFTGNIDVDGTANLDAVDIDGAVDIASTTTLNDDVTFTGANYNVTWDKSANLLQFVDNAVLRIGTGNDLDIYHSSNVNTFKTQTDLPIKFIDAGAADMATLTPNGAVSLYHNGTAAITTASGGAVTVTNGITLSDGNVTVASGHGIDFSAVTSSGSGSTSALLDDYEEGTWTPSFQAGFSATNYSQQFGRYVKIGGLIMVNYWIYTAGSGNTSNGAGVIMQGLPFNTGASGSDNPDSYARGFGSNSYSDFSGELGSHTFGHYGYNGTDKFAFYRDAANTVTANSDGTAQNNKYLIGGFIYTVDM